jgi:hypothetical protein
MQNIGAQVSLLSITLNPIEENRLTRKCVHQSWRDYSSVLEKKFWDEPRRINYTDSITQHSTDSLKNLFVFSFWISSKSRVSYFARKFFQPCFSSRLKCLVTSTWDFVDPMRVDFHFSWTSFFVSLVQSFFVASSSSQCTNICTIYTI